MRNVVLSTLIVFLAFSFAIADSNASSVESGVNQQIAVTFDEKATSSKVKSQTDNDEPCNGYKAIIITPPPIPNAKIINPPEIPNTVVINPCENKSKAPVINPKYRIKPVIPQKPSNKSNLKQQ